MHAIGDVAGLREEQDELRDSVRRKLVACEC